MKTLKLAVGGMTCANCQNKIEKKLRKTNGVRKADVSYRTGTAVVTYDERFVSHEKIVSVIEGLDYTVLGKGDSQKPDIRKVIGFLIIAVALYMVLDYFGVLNKLAPARLADENMAYGMLFVVGLVTSIHCIAMCGGLNLSQSIPREGGEARGLSVFWPTLLYNIGRVVSYTAVGFAVGGLGSAISFSETVQGVLKIVAGVFMVLMGINLLGLFPWLRRLTPSMPAAFGLADKAREAQGARGGKSPLIVGLLNALMPCGPLQAMQLYALSTGNPFSGALSMLLFSLGTVPLMFGLGAVSSALGKKFTRKVMAVGAVLVVVLGMSVLTQGWTLSNFSGVALPSGPAAELGAESGGAQGGQQGEAQGGQQDETQGGQQTQSQDEAQGGQQNQGEAQGGQQDQSQGEAQNGEQNQDDVQVIKSKLSPRGYPNITVKAGIPVKWIIDAPEGSITGCNQRMFLFEYDIEHTFEPGENVIEFVPEQAGEFQYTCWMGMIRATITVT